MSEIKLLPCPFCGGEAKVINLGFNQYLISCKDCWAETIPTTGLENTIIKWNTRKPMQDIVESLEKELELAESEKSRCVFQGLPYFDSVKGYVNGLHNAITTVKEVGGMNG